MKLGKFKEIILLSLIILLSIFLRFYKLGSTPNGLYVDEAAIGYNAYSFLQTGKDEFGKNFPVFLRSYEAYAPPLYTYVSTLPVLVFGLSVFATRFISALSGALLTFVVFLIVKKLNISKNKYLPLVSAFVFGTMPWTIFFSRGAYEANLAFLIISLSIYLLLLAREKKLYLIPAFVLLGISTYAYQAERVVSYLIILSYLFAYFRNNVLVFIKSKVFVISILLFLVIQIPQFVLAFNPSFGMRASGLFYGDKVKVQADKIFLPKIISYPLSLTREFLSNFVSYFSPRNLFWEGDPDKQRSLPAIGPVYFWMVVPYLTGLYFLIKERKSKDTLFIFSLMFSFVLIPALTRDPFSTLRSLPLTLPISIIVSLGILKIISTCRKFGYLLFIFLAALSAVFFWRSYFILLPYERAKIWGYGYEELAKQIKAKPEEEFIIDTSRIKPPYIELAFFLKYPPAKLQLAVDPTIKDNYYTNTKFDNHYKFANLETRGIDWVKDVYKDQILVGDEFAISASQAKEHFLAKVFEIKDPVGEIVFVGYKTNPNLKCLMTNFESIYCSNK